MLVATFHACGTTNRLFSLPIACFLRSGSMDALAWRFQNTYLGQRVVMKVHDLNTAKHNPVLQQADGDDKDRAAQALNRRLWKMSHPKDKPESPIPNDPYVASSNTSQDEVC